MKKIVLVLLLIMGLAFVVIKFNLIPGVNVTNNQSKSVLYLCPMHPTYTNDRPGDCPICGMRLVKKEKKEGNSGAKVVKRKMNHEGHDMKMPMEEEKSEQLKLEIDPTKQQYLGVKTSKAIKKSVEKEIKALGIVQADETKLSHIHTKFSGYLHKVFANYEGKLIKKGEPLFSVYSPELVSTQEEYLLALLARDKLKGNSFPEINASQEALFEAVRRRLELWDITDEQINNLEKTRQVTKELTLYSPENGYIIKREAFEGKQVSPEDMLYDIADLSTVWILLEVYEDDLPFIKIGQGVKIASPYESIKSLNGKITYIYPTIDPTTRTGKVRVEAVNSNLSLKPDMYIDGTIYTSIGEYVVVSNQAIIETGNRKIVFVKDNDGKFIPKEVETGPETKDGKVIYKGIEVGEEVVENGNFLLDSESNLQTVLRQFSPTHKH